jgi:hypothetical protein
MDRPFPALYLQLPPEANLLTEEMHDIKICIFEPFGIYMDALSIKE